MKKFLVFLILIAWGTGVFCQGLSVGEDTYVTVSNGAKLLVQDGDLKILATGTGMGSLLENADADNVVSVSGTGAETIVQSYITADKYHYVSSPLTNATTITFYEMWLKPFVESTNDWGDYILPTDDPLTVGQGYALYSFSTGTPNPGTKTVEYTSTATSALNSGAVSPTVAYTDASHGNNLVGNPYASAIDWDASTGWTRTNIGNTIYIWSSSQYGTYTLGDEGVGTNDVTNIINPGQGFFVKTTGSSMALSMNNNVRVHAGSGETILKSDWSWFKLAVVETEEQWSDEILIKFRPDGNQSFNEYDAKKWFSTEESVPDLYMKKSNENICSGAYGYFDEDLIVPLQFQAGTIGNQFKLHIPEMASNPEINRIFVKDHVTGITTDLLAQDYTFTAQAGDNPDRFEVFFKEAYGINDIRKNDLTIYLANGKLNIVCPQSTALSGAVNIYNVTGQAVFRNDYNRTGETISMDVNLPFGAYMVVLTPENEQPASGKILIK